MLITKEMTYNDSDKINYTLNNIDKFNEITDNYIRRADFETFLSELDEDTNELIKKHGKIKITWEVI